MKVMLYRIIVLLVIASLLLPIATCAQLPECSLTGPIYFLGGGPLGSGIFIVYPNQPLVPGVNPSLNSIPPPPGGGLAAGPNLNSASPETTFYTVAEGQYFYYDGSAWVNTGHSAGSNNAINPTCSGSYIFNLDIITGKIWRYDGTGDAINIATVSSGGCIFDLAADCAGNFYILKDNLPQRLMKFNSSGVLINTFTVTGAPDVGFGSGLCIVGNDIYYSDTVSRHGTIVGNTLYVETISNYFQGNNNNSTDMASCPGVIVHSAPLEANICSDQLPYSWNGNNYTITGSYPIAFPLPNGCDSIATLHLTVNPVVTTVPDTIIVCPSQLPYNWNGQNYSAAGDYLLTFTNSAGCDSIAGLHLVINTIPPAPAVITPINYCQGIIANALTASGTGDLIWYTSAMGSGGIGIAPVPSTSIAAITNYYVSQQLNGCEGPRAVITVQVYGIEDLPGKSIGICKDSSANLLNIYNTNGYTSAWTFENTPVPNPAIVTNAGVYQLVVSNALGCKDTAEISVTIQGTVAASAGPETTAQSNIPFQLSGTGGVTYEWSPPGPLNNAHLQNPVAVVTGSTTFYLTVKDHFGCSGSDSVHVKVFEGPGPYIPNAFSPNGDGLNDVFRPTFVGIGKLYYLRIYDRYGMLIFETKDISKGWDGTFRGESQNSGSYIWILKAIDGRGKNILEKGNVTLVR